MKIVIVTGSAHRHARLPLRDRLVPAGAESAGHEVFRFDAALDVHPCIGCDKRPHR